MDQQRNNTHNLDKRDRYMHIIQGGVALFLPLVLFYCMEAYEHNPFEEVRDTAQLLNIVLFELLAGLLFFLTGSVRLALRIEIVAAAVFGLVNHYVMLFRSTPFVPWDVFSISTAASVAGNYDFMPSMRVALVTAVFIVLFFVVHWLDFCLPLTRKVDALPSETQGKMLRTFCVRSLVVRVSGLVLMSCVLVSFVSNLQDEKYQNSHGLYPFLFTPAYMTQVNGMAVTFAMNLAYVVVEKPKGYDRKEAKELLASYEEEAEAKELPNIVVVMNEAFSDLSVLGDFKTNKEVMPFVHELQKGAKNTVTGTLHVSVCGGNTANSEYEFLTGNTMAFLPNGSIPYQQYVTGEIPNVVSHLKGLGYSTYAFHPYYASGWKREKVYPLLGFDESYFKEDLEKPGYLRSYVSDAYNYKKVIEMYENREKGKPAFIFNVTMQNHGSYEDAYKNFTPDIRVEGADSFVLEQYLSLLRVSDAELKKLIAYFEKQPSKTMLVFFGDHQPAAVVASKVQALSGILGTAPEQLQQERYQVPYLIWANFDIEEETKVDTSLNFLAAQALERAKVPLSAYQKFLLEGAKEYTAISAVRFPNEEKSKEESWYSKYQKVQYYQMFDWEKEE